ncbi:MAG: Histidine kinase, partial [Gemmatimonadetes bacterium]|nr:Histidine kinase [Gemmatimonadota bacterium]
MLESVRVRLALWHTATLALLLAGFAGATYAYLDRSTLARTDHSLKAAVGAFTHEMAAERGDEGSNAVAAREAARDFRLGDTRVMVFDAGLRTLAAGASSARGPMPSPAAV